MLEGKNYIDESAQNHYSVRQIMTSKIMTLRTLYVHIVLNIVMFSQILYIVLYAQHFLPVKVFPKYYFYDHFLELLQNVTLTDE